MKKQKVFIVGAGGQVGSSAAYAMAIKQTIQEIVLIDLHPDIANGQAMDITDAATFTNGVIVRAGDYSEIADDDIVVICSGAAQKPGQTRLDLLSVNASIISDVVKQIVAGGKNPYILLITNPVDVMTYEAVKASGLSRNRVFGTGTTLESARLRAALAEKFKVSANQINAYALGEATIGGIPLANFPGYNYDIVANIDKEVSEKVYKIINTKRATFYGIGQVISEIVAAILRPVPTIYPVCSLLDGEYGLQDVVLSVPSSVSSDGVYPIEGYRLSQGEYAKLQNSARVIRGAINSMK